MDGGLVPNEVFAVTPAHSFLWWAWIRLLSLKGIARRMSKH